ncbi:MAG TPA: class I SAM-dependent methyltransferase [Mobilitalea sp.]|nr:class I SAM-dependent methyltransferase [Mobilitalea sp.]
MQLSKRLQAVADLVTPGRRVADVGCDHAYTSIYLVKNQISPSSIAMDINQGPIDRAKENIRKYNYSDQIETRKSNGLEKLQIGEADTVLIAGMGGALMIQILSDRMDVLQSVQELILQPQSEIHKVRYFLQEQHFLITKENMMKEDGKYYVMMKALPKINVENKTPYVLSKEEHFHYGRLLLENKNQVLKEFLLWDLSLCEGIQNTLQNGQSENSIQRQKKIQDRINLINLGLGYYEAAAEVE